MNEADAASTSDTGWTGPAARRLAGYSFLILFFELALIRYLPGYVRVFGFYLNFVLIATFLGMGVGLLRAESARRLRWLSLPVTVVLLAAVYVLADVLVQVPADSDEVLWAIYPAQWEARRTLGVLPTTTILFTLCALFFVPLGALLGRLEQKRSELTRISNACRRPHAKS